MKITATQPDEWEEQVGDFVQEWIDQLPIDGVFRRHPNEEDEDLFGGEDVAWVFTQRGQRLYNSMVSKVNAIGNKLFPDYDINVSSHTGVIEP